MIKSKLKNLFGKAIIGAVLASLLIGAPIAASATTYAIGAQNEPFNQTLYYSQPRKHTGALASFTLTSHSGMCAGSFWNALRNDAGDSTMKLSFSGLGSKYYVWNNGSSSIPANWYYITARNDCAGMPGATYTWTGNLYLNG